MTPAAPDAPPLLEVWGITKLFGETEANREIDLSVRRGEKHALLGENGAGKSTLVKIIYGVMQPDAGRILWQGEAVSLSEPAEARALGIGMVFQHFSVFEALTVAENIALALPKDRTRRLRRRIREVSQGYGLPLDPDRAVHTLSTGERQRLEIIRCLLQEPKLLIMDEPTSVLTPQEAELLFETLNRLAGEGRAILYISHKLEEVRALCDRATILRAGRVVATCDPRRETARSLARMMVGGAIGEVERRPHLPAAGAPRLVVDHIDLPAESDLGVSLKGLALEVRPGEVMGIAGIAGEGQAELMAALTGEVLVNRPDAILIDGQPVGRLGPTARRRLGAAFVPEERNGHAALPGMTLAENVLLSHHRTEGLAKGGWLDLSTARDWARRVRERFDVRAAGEDPKAGALSGGNLQKFVVGREILRKPSLLVVSQPTWGVDAGAAALIQRALIELAEAGSAVLVISQDLEELFAISDRIAVIHHGRLSKAHPTAEMTAEKVGLLMGGAHPEDVELPEEEVA